MIAENNRRGKRLSFKCILCETYCAPRKRILGLCIKCAKSSNDPLIKLRLSSYLKTNDPRRWRARQLVNKAIKNNVLTKPTSCEHCQIVDDDIVAHHDDYSKPLDVIWLCHSCHMKIELASNVNDINLKELSNLIKELRIKLNLSHYQLAKKIGVSTNTLVNLENRKHIPRPVTLSKLWLFCQKSPF